MQLLAQAVEEPTTPIMAAAKCDSSIDFIYALKKDSGGNLSDGVPLSLYNTILIKRKSTYKNLCKCLII